MSKDWIVVATVRKDFVNSGKKTNKETKELVGSYENQERAKEMADQAMDKGFYIPYANKNNPGQSHRRVIPSIIKVVNTKQKGGHNG